MACSDATARDLSLEFLGRYELEERLGQGGMGVVWRGRRRADGLPVAMKLLSGVARGLAYAHGLGVTHRDLKPDNVLVGRDGVPKVADCGLAKLGDVTQVRTKTGIIHGTPRYLSPEQITGKTLGPSEDLYAFGVLAFEVLRGAPPFGSPSLADLLLKHLTEPSPFMPAVDRLVRACLAKSPFDRPRDAAAVGAEFELLAAPCAAVDAPTVELATLDGRRHRIELRDVVTRALAAVLPSLERDRTNTKPLHEAWRHDSKPVSSPTCPRSPAPRPATTPCDRRSPWPKCPCA